MAYDTLQQVAASPFPTHSSLLFPSFPIISVSHGELAYRPSHSSASLVMCLIFLDLSVASHPIAHSLYFSHLLSLISQTFLLELPLTVLYFMLFFAGHSFYSAFACRAFLRLRLRLYFPLTVTLYLVLL